MRYELQAGGVAKGHSKTKGGTSTWLVGTSEVKKEKSTGAKENAGGGGGGLFLDSLCQETQSK
jgi:hypothetical protein